jgi:hypothetical protein
MNATTERIMCDCGHLESEHSDITRGYGTDANGKTRCYDCCAEEDKRIMREDGRTYLYLDTKNKTVSNWPGSFKAAINYMRTGRHNIAGKRYDVWFSFEGQQWHGVTYGDNTQICHCKRIAS